VWGAKAETRRALLLNAFSLAYDVTNRALRGKGNGREIFPQQGIEMSEHIGSYLKKHSEALVKDLGIEAAARICGKSKATLGRYYSNDPDNSERFMPLDVAARLEAEASYPHVTVALADLAGVTLSWNEERRNASSGSINSDVVALSQRFALLMAEYHVSIADGTISLNEAKRMLKEAQALQEVLLQGKLKLEEGAVG